jgi:VanZ family protein
MQPGMRAYAHFEHVIAFAVFGALFAFAYPRRVILVCCVVFISAVALEYLQTLAPDRHGKLIDAFEKVIGGALGNLAAHGILWFTQARKRSSSFASGAAATTHHSVGVAPYRQ